MKAIVISIGDELLIGQTINTNAAWIGQELSKLGGSVIEGLTISDQSDKIIETGFRFKFADIHSALKNIFTK